MKKIISSVPNGGMPLSNDIIQAVLNGEPWTAIESLLQGIAPTSASGNVGVIVSGCAVSGAGPYTIAAGIVYLNGQFMALPQQVGVTLPQYIVPATLVNTPKTFADGVSRNLITQQDATITNVLPGSGQYIAVTTGSNIGSWLCTQWQSLSLLNGWASFNSPVRWRFRAPGLIEIAGRLASGSATNVIFANIAVTGYAPGFTPAVKNIPIWNPGSGVVGVLNATVSGANIQLSTAITGQPEVSCSFSVDSFT